MRPFSSKQLFWQTLPWIDPLALTALLRAESLHPQLLYSGKAVPEQNGGRFTFLPFQPLLKLLPKAGSDYRALLWHTLGAKREVPAGAPSSLQHFCGGLSGFFSYDFAHEFESFSANSLQNADLPLACFELFETLIAYDHERNEAIIAGWFWDEAPAQRFFDIFSTRFLATDLLVQAEENNASNFSAIFTPEISYAEYERAFLAIQSELKNGNSYQVNFSQKWSTSLAADSCTIFQHLAHANPAPMMFWGEWGNEALISCSPERLFSLKGNAIFTQPIAGTRCRGQDTAEDAKLEAELRQNSKELAEHLMLVDLMRSDVGRVSAFGSVQVQELARIEKYATVMHLVSDITAELAAEKNAFDLISALFPGGTITGAPKVETMDILGRLERSARGAYCGSAGYFSFNGNADFNILIRTLQKSGDRAEIRAGGGIVLDSDPQREYEESKRKALGVIAPLGSIAEKVY